MTAAPVASTPVASTPVTLWTADLVHRSHPRLRHRAYDRLPTAGAMAAPARGAGRTN